MTNNLFHSIGFRINRNAYNMNYQLCEKNEVNIGHSELLNVGDVLGPEIVLWMLRKKGISPHKKVKKTKHLFTVGSIIGRGLCDCTIWGSGILKESDQNKIKRVRKRYFRKNDFRAVRGPVTRNIILTTGYKCPEIYGDPAVLMPLIYQPKSYEKKYPVSLILHHRTSISGEMDRENEFSIKVDPQLVKNRKIHLVDPKTNNYSFFIDELVSSDYVISSSLHGIILAESFGIPAIFLNWGMNDQTIKFKDWYFSTGRNITYCRSIEEALNENIPGLPDLSSMRNELMISFPYDLWEE